MATTQSLRYYVTFAHGRGHGAVDVGTDRPISCWDDVQALRQKIVEGHSGYPMQLSEIVILGWTRYEDPVS